MEKEVRRTIGSQTIDALSYEEAVEIIHSLHIRQAEIEALDEKLNVTADDVANLKRDYADLFDITPIGLFLLTEGGGIARLNRMAAKMLEIDRKLAQTTLFVTFVEHYSAPAFFDFMRTALETRKKQGFGITMRKIGGGVFPVECELTPVYDQDGNFRHLRAVITDAEKRKKAVDIIAKLISGK